MKRLAALTILFLFYTKAGISQTAEPRTVLFGLKIGFTYTSMNFNRGYPPPVTPISISMKSGITGGMMLNIALNEKIFLQPEYSFLTSSSLRKDSAIRYYLTYLSFPLLLKYNLVPGLYISAGPQFDLLVSAKKKKIVTSVITHDTEERNIGVTGGGEYVFKNNFSISGRYTLGLNHIGIGQRSNVQEYKSRQILVAAGFYF